MRVRSAIMRLPDPRIKCEPGGKEKTVGQKWPNKPVRPAERVKKSRTRVRSAIMGLSDPRHRREPGGEEKPAGQKWPDSLIWPMKKVEKSKTRVRSSIMEIPDPQAILLLYLRKKQG